MDEQDYTLMTDETHPEVMKHFRRICERAGIKVPEVRIFEDLFPEAGMFFDSGSILSALGVTGVSINHIFFEKGFMERLEPKEVAMVLAHEVAHKSAHDFYHQKRYKAENRCFAVGVLLLAAGAGVVEGYRHKELVRQIDKIRETIQKKETSSSKKKGNSRRNFIEKIGLVSLGTSIGVPLLGGTLLHAKGQVDIGRTRWAVEGDVAEHLKVDLTGAKLMGGKQQREGKVGFVNDSEKFDANLRHMISALEKLKTYTLEKGGKANTLELDYRIKEMRAIQGRQGGKQVTEKYIKFLEENLARTNDTTGISR